MTVTPTLFGRDRELSTWKQVKGQLERGQGGCISFSGGPGLGKTALLQTVATEVADAGWTYLAARNDAVNQNLPGNLLWQFFARQVREGELGEAPFDGPGELLFHFVRQEERDVEAAALSFAAAWVLRSLVESGPLVLLVDDLQWADELSLQVLSSMLSLVADEPILFVFGVRSSPAEPVSREVELLLSRSDGSRVVLSSLKYRDIADWLSKAAGAAPREQVSQIQIASAGVPFFVAELIAALGEDDQAVGERSAQEMLAERVSSLDPTDREILRAISFLGDHAIDEHVVALTGAGTTQLEATYRHLRDQRLITPELPLRITHSLVADAINLGTTPAEASAINRRIADVIDDSNPTTVAAFLVETDPAGDLTTVRRLLTAGRQALALGSAEIAFRFFQRALREGGLGDDLKAELLASSGQALLKAGRAQPAIEAWQAALSLELNPPLRIECQLGIGDAEYAIGNLPAATSRFTEALAVGETTNSSLPAGTTSRIVARIASTGVLNQSGLAAPGAHIETLVAADGSQDTIDDRTLLVQEALRLTLAGAPVSKTGPLARRALAGNKLIDEISVEGPVLAMAIATLIYAERDEESMKILDQAMVHARRRGSVLGYAMLSSCRGFLHFFRGRLRLAQADHEAALATTALGLNPYFDASVDQLCQIHLARGDQDAAAALLDQAQLEDGLPEVILALRNHVHGLVARADGDHETALAFFLAAVDQTEAYGGQMLKGWDRSAIETAMTLGQQSLARGLAERLLGRSRLVAAPRFLGFTLRTVARTQEFGPAVATLRESIQLLTANEAKYEQALAMRDLSKLLSDHDEGDEERRQESRELGLRALDLAEQIGANALKAELLERFSSGPSSFSTGSKADRLSVSELKVCQLAIRGLTNRQIAEHLFVTVKGVEWHLSRSYKKLGISSRRDLGGHLAGIDELID